MDDATEHVAVDAAALDQLLRSLRQGDVLEIGKLVTLWSPDSPAYPREVEGVPHEEPVMAREGRLASGLCVVVSQDCDLARDPSVEQYVVVAPLTRVDDKAYALSNGVMSVRLFAYPPLPGRADEQLVVDGRVLQSIEKLALLSPHIRRIECPLSEPRRAALGGWLGRRLGRTAFPDEIVTQVSRPIDRAVAQIVAKQPFDRAFACVIWTGLRWTPGRPNCSLLLLTDPGLREQHKVHASEVEGLTRAVRKALNHAARGGDYTINANVLDASEVSAADLLEYHEIALDIG